MSEEPDNSFVRVTGEDFSVIDSPLSNEAWVAIHIRCRALAAAARTSQGKNPEVVMSTADRYVQWICKGIK